MKTAFIHIMKTAGSTVNFAMANNAFWSKSYLLLNAGIYREPDWTDEELNDFLTWKTNRAYVHNHAFNWLPETIQKYNDHDWLTFSFYRHPGDQWCSYYYWARENEEVKRRRLRKGQSEPIAWKYTLDEFLHHAWACETIEPPYPNAFRNLRRHLDLPECWQKLGYVDVWSNENFLRFVSQYFDKNDLQLAPHNESANKGYDHYRQAGLISDSTHQQLISSHRFQDYQTLLGKPHERGCPDDYSKVDAKSKKQTSVWANLPILKEIRSQSTASRYVILANDGAASQWLTEYVHDHPDIQSFGEEFDRFERTWANQKKWLHNFYIRLPNKNRKIQAIGFKTSLGSIADPDRFREFLEKHQIKIVYLSNRDPIRAAIADHCTLRGDADSVRTKILQAEIEKSENEIPDNGIRLTSREFQDIMQHVQQQKSVVDYISTLKVPKIGLDDETLLLNEAALLNKLWLFLEIGTARTTDEIATDRPMYPGSSILNLKELRDQFPEYDGLFEK